MKLLTLIKYDLKHYFNSITALLAMIVLPILIIVAAVQISTALFVNHSFVDPITLLIVDEEQSFYTNFFIQKIIETPSLQTNIEIIKTNQEEGQKLLDTNKGAGMVIIPETFTDDMQKGIYQPLTVIGNHNKPLQATMIKEGMESVTNLMSAAQSAVFTVIDYAREQGLTENEIDQIFQKSAISFSLKALGRDQLFSQTIKTPWMDMEPIHFYFSSILILFLSLYGLQGMYLTINERQNKITRRIRSVGLPLWKILIGKWTALSLFLFAQASIILWLSKALKLFQIKGSLKLSLLLLLIISACISTLILLISALSKNDYVASMAIFIISILGVFIGGGIIPFAYMPDFIEQLGPFTLNYWASQGLTYALFTTQTGIVWKSTWIIGLLTLTLLSCVFLILEWKERKHETM